mmetsp:Transcript_12341/g.19582  ORF Transcript_12341/g.19582 Transcript_12341/m.19582 type:complete len:243 (-) Transcript_12341:415-1143(-)
MKSKALTSSEGTPVPDPDAFWFEFDTPLGTFFATFELVFGLLIKSKALAASLSCVDFFSSNSSAKKSGSFCSNKLRAFSFSILDLPPDLTFFPPSLTSAYTFGRTLFSGLAGMDAMTDDLYCSRLFFAWTITFCMSGTEGNFRIRAKASTILESGSSCTKFRSSYLTCFNSAIHKCSTMPNPILVSMPPCLTNSSHIWRTCDISNSLENRSRTHFSMYNSGGAPDLLKNSYKSGSNFLKSAD